MTHLNDLVELDLLDLSARLVNDRTVVNDILAEDFSLVLQLLGTRVVEADRGVVTRNWRLIREGYDITLAHAQELKVIQAPKAVILRLNFLVVLASRADNVSDRDELSSHAREIFLENATLSLGEAYEKVSRWRSLPLDEIRDLRYLKNLLKPLVHLAPGDITSEESREVGQWLALLPSLP